MLEGQTHRASLVLALVGALLMLAVAVSRLEPPVSLPHYESSRPMLPDWPTHSSMGPRV